MVYGSYGPARRARAGNHSCSAELNLAEPTFVWRTQKGERRDKTFVIIRLDWQGDNDSTYNAISLILCQVASWPPPGVRVQGIYSVRKIGVFSSDNMMNYSLSVDSAQFSLTCWDLWRYSETYWDLWRQGDIVKITRETLSDEKWKIFLPVWEGRRVPASHSNYMTANCGII